MKKILLALGFVAFGCGGSQSSQVNGDEVLDAGMASERPASNKKVTSSKKVTPLCNDMCKRITRCAMDDARENLSPAEFKKLDVATIAPKHTMECIKACESSELSEAKRVLAQTCTKNADLTCEQFGECLAPLDDQESER